MPCIGLPSEDEYALKGGPLTLRACLWQARWMRKLPVEDRVNISIPKTNERKAGVIARQRVLKSLLPLSQYGSGLPVIHT